ncbi:MAG: hypothetical protein ACRCYY_12000, partial [Trueperaceae bacterium]
MSTSTLGGCRVIIGVDPHPGSHTAAALEETGKVLGHLTITNSETGLAEFEQWLKSYEIKRIVVEGANNPFAHSLSERLLKTGHALNQCQSEFYQS